MEAASHGEAVKDRKSQTDDEKDALDQVSCEDDGHWIRACFEASCNAECRATTAQTPPEI